MKIKRIFAVGLMGFLVLFSTLFIQAQANKTTSENESVKALRKALVKHSRYQFQELTIAFKPRDFKSCEVSYQFEQPGSLGDENFGQATVDRLSPASAAINNTSTTRTVYSPITGNTAGQMSNGNPNFSLREATFFNTNAITSFNLFDLDSELIGIDSSSKGVYLTIKTLDGKSLIEKTPIGNGSSPMKLNFDFLPVVDVKKAEKVKELLVTAIKQCREQK